MIRVVHDSMYLDADGERDLLVDRPLVGFAGEGPGLELAPQLAHSGRLFARQKKKEGGGGNRKKGTRIKGTC